MISASFVIIAVLFRNGYSQYLNGPVRDDGSWGWWNYCFSGHYVSSFQVKAVRPIFYDAEGISALAFGCSDKNQTLESRHKIQSAQGNSGSWKAEHSCRSGEFITAFRIRYQPYQGVWKNDVATANVEMRCSSNQTMMGEGTVDGSWTEWLQCLPGSAVCGLQTKVDGRFSTDRLGLITFNAKCCELPPDKFENDALLKIETTTTVATTVTSTPKTTTEDAIANEILPLEARIADDNSYEIAYYVLGAVLILFIIGSLACIVGNFGKLRQPRQAIEDVQVYPVAVVSEIANKIRGGKLPLPRFMYNAKTERCSEA